MRRQLAPIIIASIFAVFLAGPCRAEPTLCLEWNGLKFFKIPDGEFWMGANLVSGKEVGFKDEKPRTRVRTKSFCMLQSYLSVDQTKALRSMLSIKLGEDEDENDNQMTWAAAVHLADELGRRLKKKVRLPTEAEWEFAARGGLENGQFPWGNTEDSFGGIAVKDIVLRARRDCKLASIEPAIRENALKQCLPKNLREDEKYARLSEFACIAKMINTKLPNDIPNNYGLLNLVNNAWEWTSSKYTPYPYQAGDGRENLTRGKLKSEFRVLRGGGNEETETCQGYTSLRGFGNVGREYQSSYKVRFVLED